MRHDSNSALVRLAFDFVVPEIFVAPEIFGAPEISVRTAEDNLASSGAISAIDFKRKDGKRSLAATKSCTKVLPSGSVKP